VLLESAQGSTEREIRTTRWWCSTSVLEGGNVSISQLRTEMEKQMSWGSGGGHCAAQGEAARPVVTRHDGGETPSPDLFF
jgi:hypothetical protein